MIDTKLLEEVFSILKEKRVKLITAESLTAGMIASEFAKIPGASAVLWGGIIAYDAEVKQGLLSVPKETISLYGVVSPQTARAMAWGALKIYESRCHCPAIALAIAVTGNAGPLALEDKPVGTVHIAAALNKKPLIQFFNQKKQLEADEIFFLENQASENEIITKDKACLFTGSRQEIREQTVNEAMKLILTAEFFVPKP